MKDATRLMVLLVAVQWVTGLLAKPFTLKITATLPIGGKIAPLGDMCTKSIDLLLSTVNNRSDLLPNYNLIADIVDDQCQASEAVKHLFPYFLADMHSANISGDHSTIGQYLIPKPNFSQQSSASMAYIPPLLIGGMCSTVCEVIAKYVQNFHIINFSAACNSANLANRHLYPNFYRILSEIQYVATGVAFAKNMGWNKLAIISDAVPIELKAIAEAIPRFAAVNITIMAIEIFVDNPTESVARIKATGARIIQAYCYFDTCPALACEAFRQGLYGPRIIWYFAIGRDFVNSPLPGNCTRSMASAIDSGALYQTVLSSKYLSTMSQIGITGAQLDSFLEQNIPGLWKNPLLESRMNCFDSILPAIYILDSVERTLNKGGSSLKDFIGNRSKRIELEQLFRGAISSLNITAFQNHIRYAPGEQETYVPSGIVQSQINGSRRMVSRDNGGDGLDHKERFEFVDRFLWSTSEGKMPNYEATLVQRRSHVVPGVALFILTLSALSIVALFLISTTHICLRMIKRQPINRFSALLNGAVLSGLALLLSTILAFPVQNESNKMSLFCQVAPPMVVAAYSLLSGALLLKVALPVNKRSVVSTVRHQKITLGFLLWLSANAICCILWYVLAQPPTTTQLVISSYNDDSDTLLEESWDTCAKSGGDLIFEEIFAGCLLTLQGVCLLAALILSITVTSKRRKQNVDTVNAARVVYILIPATFACVLAAAIVHRPDILYYLLSSIVIFLCIAIVAVMFGHSSRLDIINLKIAISHRRQISSSKRHDKKPVQIPLQRTH